MPRSAARVVSAHHDAVDSLEAGATTRDTISASARSGRGGRPEQGGQPQLHGHRMHGRDVPVRQRRGDRHRLPGRDQRRAFQRRLDCVDRLVRQPGQARQGLMPHLAALPVGAPQVRRLIVVATVPACPCKLPRILATCIAHRAGPAMTR